jgi:transcriptional regulator with XRE-family HTH domain
MTKASAPKRSIGKTLRRIRESKGLTLKKVEEQTGIGVSHLSQIENDLRNINVTKLEKLADCYECEVADFFPRRPRSRRTFSRGKTLTQAQEEILRAMEDKEVARHLLEQARMRRFLRRSEAKRPAS